MSDDTTYLITRERLAEIFDEWMRRYRENPEQFAGLSGDSYGENAADYFLKIMREV